MGFVNALRKKSSEILIKSSRPPKQSKQKEWTCMLRQIVNLITRPWKGESAQAGGGLGRRGGRKHRKGLLVDSVVYNAATPHHALLYSQDKLYNQKQM